MSVTYDRSVVFSGFLHQWNWPPRYNWNIVECAIKQYINHKIKPPSVLTRTVSDLTEWYPRLQYHDVQTLEYRYISKERVWSNYFTYIVLEKSKLNGPSQMKYSYLTMEIFSDCHIYLSYLISKKRLQENEITGNRKYMTYKAAMDNKRISIFRNSNEYPSWM